MMTLEWNEIEIKNLRRRLGWTQSDLARRLHCDTEAVFNWEAGNLKPELQFIQEFEILNIQAEQSSEELHLIPVAEEMCDQKTLAQIDFNKLSDDIKG